MSEENEEKLDKRKDGCEKLVPQPEEQSWPSTNCLRLMSNCRNRLRTKLTSWSRSLAN